MCGQALVPLVAEVYTWGGQKTIRRCSPSNVWVSGMELESLALEPSPQPSFDHLRCIGLCVFVHYVKKFGNDLKSGLSPKQSPLLHGEVSRKDTWCSILMS